MSQAFLYFCFQIVISLPTELFFFPSYWPNFLHLRIGSWFVVLYKPTKKKNPISSDVDRITHEQITKAGSGDATFFRNTQIQE